MTGLTITKPSQDEAAQIKVLAELTKGIRRSALACDETVRTLILKALRARGVSVTDNESVDRRKIVGRRLLLLSNR